MNRTLWIGLAVLALVACGPASRRGRSSGGGGGGGGGAPGAEGGEEGGEGEDRQAAEGEGDEGPECPAPLGQVPRGMSAGLVFPAAPFETADGEWDRLYARCGKRAIVVVSAAPW